jgi:hypothetical protein
MDPFLENLLFTSELPRKKQVKMKLFSFFLSYLSFLYSLYFHFSQKLGVFTQTEVSGRASIRWFRRA